MDIFKMMKEAQKLQAAMKKMQKELKKITVEESSKKGEVKITINGENRLKSISIEQELIERGDKKDMEKQIMEAFEKARDRMDKEVARMTKAYTGGASGDVQNLLS